MNSRIDFSSKRVQLALRFFGYGITALATVVLTAVAIFYAMGYRFNQSDLTFKQGGLLQLTSTPGGAQVRVDSQTQSFTTPGQISLSAGWHTIELTRDGYSKWTKMIMMQPGQLLKLDYVRLMPVSLSTQPLKQFGSVVAAVPSPDRTRMIIQEAAASPTFTLVDLSDSKKPLFSSFTIPQTQLATTAAGGLGELSIVEWDANSHYILLQQKHDGVSDFIRIDRGKSGADVAVNVSQQFRLKITEAHFATNADGVVYALTDDVVRRLDVSGGNASAALVTGVKEFSVGANDTVVFVAERAMATDPTKRQVVGLLRGKEEQIIRTVELEKKIITAYGTYSGHNYLAIGAQDGQLQVLVDPSSANTNAIVFDDLVFSQVPRWLTFSPNGRMVNIGAGNAMATFDIEIAKVYHSSLPAVLTSTTPPRWLDNFHMVTDVDSRLRVFEFDGQNDAVITTVAPGFGVALSQDGKVIFSIGDGAGMRSLQASTIVKN